MKSSSVPRPLSGRNAIPQGAYRFAPRPTYSSILYRGDSFVRVQRNGGGTATSGGSAASTLLSVPFEAVPDGMGTDASTRPASASFGLVSGPPQDASPPTTGGTTKRTHAHGIRRMGPVCHSSRIRSRPPGKWSVDRSMTFIFAAPRLTTRAARKQCSSVEPCSCEPRPVDEPRRSDGILVTVLELPARWDARDEAVDELDRLLARGPADLAIVPELAFTGYVSPRGDFDLTRFAEPLDGPTTAALARIAKRRDVHIVGPLVLREGDVISNAAVVVGPSGDVLTTYRKRHPWIPERWATPGTKPVPLVDIGGVKVTLAICYDLHFLPFDAADVLVSADLLVFTSAWVDTEDTRLPQLARLARAFGIVVANANWGAGVVAVPGQGGSVILDAEGRRVARVRPGEVRADARVVSRTSTRAGRARPA